MSAAVSVDFRGTTHRRRPGAGGDLQLRLGLEVPRRIGNVHINLMGRIRVREREREIEKATPIRSRQGGARS